MRKWICLFATILFCLLGILTTLVAQQASYPTSIIVSQDGSGDYNTIQQAVNSTRDLGIQRITIFIKNGTYHEKLIIPTWKTNISLIGENKEKTIITNADYSGKAVPGGKDAYGKNAFTTHTSYTVLVQANDFIAENLTIENTSGQVGQAVALHIEGDRCAIKNCKILGNQDTLYATTEKSRQLYIDCYIEGTTDFIFGEATVVFQNCIIKSLANSYVTAAATTPRQKFGFVFFECKLIADTSVTKVFLGRPWRPFAKTVFIHCELGNHILPGGWDAWKGDAMFPDKEKTTCYAEYQCFGTGSKTKERVTWSRQLSVKEAKLYTFKNIFGGTDNWNP